MGARPVRRAAAALAQELQRRGYIVDLATELRAEKYGGDFPARKIHRIPSATLTSRSPLAVAGTFSRLGLVFSHALSLLLLRPAVIQTKGLRFSIMFWKIS